MSSLVSGYQYDIFISYRHKDNKYDGWVTEFVSNLRKELDATFKDDISIYFDENPHDGLLETHVVNDSLREKLKCLIFIPVVSHTYCDTKSFAWKNELLAFNQFLANDALGKNIKLRNGNVASRILPVQIHELEADDKAVLQKEIGHVRSIKFIFQSPGVNRPLREIDDEEKLPGQLIYRDQINKVANAIKEILSGILRGSSSAETAPVAEETLPAPKKIKRKFVLVTALIVCSLFGIFYLAKDKISFGPSQKNPSVAILPFRNSSGSPDMDFYGIGMAAEIRTRLSMAKQFSFISSMQATLNYANTTKSTREIGDELGVDYILTGLIQRSGNRIKVETELVNAENGSIIWAIPFEQEIEDVFLLQSEIASSVLKQFTKEKTIWQASSVTDNITAYAHYMKGNHLLESVFGDSADFETSYLPVIEQYEKAIQLDSSFVDAWTNLIGVETYIFMHNEYDDERRQKIQRYYDDFNSRFTDPHARKLVKGHFSYRVTKDYEQALQLMLGVLESDPENIHATFAVSSLYRRKLDLDNALKYAVKQVQINPSHAGNWLNLSMIHSMRGSTEKAFSAALKAWDLSHSKPYGEQVIMMAIEAGKPLEGLPDDLRTMLSFEVTLYGHLLKREWEKAKTICLKEKEYGQLASVYHELNKKDSALYYWRKLPVSERMRDSTSYLVYRGDRKKAIEYFHRRHKKEFQSSFQNIEKAEIAFMEVDLLTDLGMYPQATQKLRLLAKEFPQFHIFNAFVNFPFYDKAKSAYPPFKNLLDSLVSTNPGELVELAEL